MGAEPRLGTLKEEGGGEKVQHRAVDKTVMKVGMEDSQNSVVDG